MVSGVLVIDKPQGLTSHDVVAVARRCLRESRIGHTGTLDPLATGVLPLACGPATRLVRFLTSADKDYEARIRFGIATDSYDSTGQEIARSDVQPTRESIERALESLRGEYLQMPPAFSAKKVAGRRAYELARREESVTLTPVPVRVTRAELLGLEGMSASVGITCSAGFYVRSFAHTLGELVGSGAHLEALLRTRSGQFGIDQAVGLTELQERPDVALERIVPLDRLLGGFPCVRVTDEGRRRVSHGQAVQVSHLLPGQLIPADEGSSSSRDAENRTWVRLLDAEGRLLAMATLESASGSLHPSVVLPYN